ncbi:MAG: hypothetical protein A2Y25_00815 [Candidatus Melainabacteria bacterium GWF2_37_15]|nr:MAG: hypothetical protein A2Y25_00815 [Candidatus Melainabacteria bacterium GWF2_37_15]
MKKYLKLYLIFSIFLLFCTGCNIKDNKSFIKIGNEEDVKGKSSSIVKYKNGAVIINDGDSGSSNDSDNRFERDDVNFGPGEIKFGEG